MDNFYNKLKEYLIVYEFNNKIRLGNKEDGGYVIGDINHKYNCYISCGINREESFTRDFLNEYNYIIKEKSYGFDGTILEYPIQYTKNIKFIKKNINNFDDDYNTTLLDILNNNSNIFIKMDIEGWEYTWLEYYENKTLLNNISQMVIEFHGLNENNYLADGCKVPVELNNLRKIKVFKILSKYFYIIHVHGNNWCQVKNGIPNVLEITFLNKKFFNKIPELNKTPFPIDIDFPNTNKFPEINLNYYPFCQR